MLVSTAKSNSKSGIGSGEKRCIRQWSIRGRRFWLVGWNEGIKVKNVFAVIYLRIKKIYIFATQMLFCYADKICCNQL